MSYLLVNNSESILTSCQNHVINGIKQSVMNKVLTILFVLLFVSPVYSTAQTKKTVGNYRRARKAMKFEQTLRISDSMEWQYVVEPSFSAPYSVGCQKKKNGPELVATTTKMKKRGVQYIRPVRIKTSRMAISESQDSIIADFFRLANKAVKLRQDEIVFDGTSYIYYVGGNPAVTNNIPKDEEVTYLNQTCDFLYQATNLKDKELLNRALDMIKNATFLPR